MSDLDDIPEPDRLPGVPHPRETSTVYGQEQAEASFLEAFNSGRLHHAWLITGPEGVGKATLAWRMARFLLATTDTSEGLFDAPPPPETLNIDPEAPVSRRMLALSEPRLFLLRKPWDPKSKRLKQDITVDEARKLKGFFAMSSADGGRRVVIVDAADEMNSSAANAVLKLLEEPPDGAVLLLVSHHPSRLLPTIRSRCRTLRCNPLSEPDMSDALEATGTALPDEAGALSELSGGSVGNAHLLLNEGGLELYAALVRLMSAAPGMDRTAALAFCNRYGGRGASVGIERALQMIDLFLARLARTGVIGPPAIEAAPGETAVLTRLCPSAEAARTWARLQQEQTDRTRHGVAVNLDPAALLLDTVLKINAGVEQVSPAPA